MQPDWRSMIGHRTFDDLWAGAVERLQQMGSKVVTNLNMGPFRILLSLFLEAVSVVYDILADVIAPSGFIDHATGPWLDEGVKARGLSRHEAVTAEGTVVFSRTEPGGPILIPKGTVVKTDPLPAGEALVFVSKAEAILPDGALSVNVPVKAEFPGAIYNVSDGAIKHLVTHVPGIEAVTNLAAWLTLEGADEEAEDLLRARGKLAWQSLASGGTEGAYRSWALEVAGVVEAVVVTGEPRGPGTMDLIITSSTGVPTAQLLSSVQAHIDKRKPLLDNVLVKGPTTKAIAIDVELTLPPVGGDPAAIEAEARRRIQALFSLDAELQPAVRPLTPGQGLNRSQITWQLKLDPVENAEINAPVANEPGVAGQLLTLGALTVTVVRRS